MFISSLIRSCNELHMNATHHPRSEHTTRNRVLGGVRCNPRRTDSDDRRDDFDARDALGRVVVVSNVSGLERNGRRCVRLSVACGSRKHRATRLNDLHPLGVLRL